MKLKRILKWSALALLLVLVVWFQIAYWTSTNDCGRTVAPGADAMKAIVYCDYGPPEVLRFEAISKPVPNDNQVLIKVRAASVNPYDWHFMRGAPYLVRMEAGLRKPKVIRLGGDVAGQIEAVGKNVTQFKAGDEVFGLCSGSFAEYCLGRSKLAMKPANVPFEQAASVPVAGITALQALRKAKVASGQKVLINGASGGVGTFAVQIAHSLGADVTGVCSTRNVDMVMSLGADQVIDYTKGDFTKEPRRYDAIIDCVGNRGLAEFRQVLTPGGNLVMIGGGGPNEGKWIAPLLGPLHALIVSPFVKQKLGMMLAEVNKDDLVTLAAMMEKGQLKPVIDRSYKLSQVPDAVRYLEAGHARGKVIVVLEQQ
jgi:NADPH:quinone reductase-like Zn-dependent oxidoreductase